MSKPKDDMFSTNIRMPKHLAHKLGILADSDDRSLNSYMVKALQEHVTNFEEEMLGVYGLDDFLETFESIFGKEHLPYILHEEVISDSDQIKNAIQNIKRGKVKTIKNPRSTD